MQYRNVKTGMVITTTGAVHGDDWVPAAKDPAVNRPEPAAVSAAPVPAETGKPPAARKQGKRAAEK